MTRLWLTDIAAAIGVIAICVLFFVGLDIAAEILARPTL